MALRPAARGRLLCLVLLALAVALPHYATAERGGAQASAGPAQAPLMPALDIIPSDDGLSVFVVARVAGDTGGGVYTTMRIGPTGHKGSYAMPRLPAVDTYAVNVPGFAASQHLTGTIAISTSVGLGSGELEFERGYVPADTPAVVVRAGSLELTLANANSLGGAAYLVAAPSFAPPGPPPAGRRIVGRAYGLRASGALVQSEKPMNMRIYYTPAELAGADPQSLAIYAWDQAAQSWQPLGGAVFPQGYVAVAVDRLTSYALMAEAPEATYLPLIVR